MCAAIGDTPTAVSAGTTITAAMMYDAVTGTARPRIQTAIAPSTTVIGNDPPAIATMRPAALRPSPVSVTTPTMTPATAVVERTDNASSPPAVRAEARRVGPSGVPTTKLIPTAATVAQN